MPWKWVNPQTYYIIPHTDTRPLEMFIGVKTVLWGILLLLSDMGMRGLARPGLGAMFIVIGAFQVFAVHHQYPRWCAMAAALTATTWVSTAYAIVTGGSSIPFGLLAAYNAAAALQTLYHRQASL